MTSDNMTGDNMTGDNMTSDALAVAAAEVRRLAADALARSRGIPAHAAIAAAIAEVIERLDGPLRVAIAGRVKAGKSTLLNALVGERLAPTDAGECTKLVSSYHEGIAYDVRAVFRDGGSEPVPFTRRDGALEMDTTRVDLDRVDHLDITWPSSALRQLTLVDTPGLASLHDENSLRTRDFLAMGEDRPSDVDAVIYLMRHLHRKDAEFLGAFCDRDVAAASPVNAIAVLSRADEIGAGRADALESARRIATRLSTDPDLASLCAAVVPVAGLIAETGQTFREQEASAIRMLARTSPAELDLMLLSADQFVEPSASELTVESRRDLLDRLGMFGLRFLVTEVAEGRATTAGDMARALLDHSGLDELRRIIHDHFLPRAQVLKARSALAQLRVVAREMAPTDRDGARWLAAAAERIEASTTEFALLRLGHLVATGLVRLRPEEVREVEHVVALGSTDGAVPGTSALEGIERWRMRGSDPMADSALTEAAETMARVYEVAYQETRA